MKEKTQRRHERTVILEFFQDRIVIACEDLFFGVKLTVRKNVEFQFRRFKERNF